METTVARALAFLDQAGSDLGAAWVRHRCADGPRTAVIEALAGYQNEDGGFGRGLEVDIKAPVSNPFAARLAMQVLISINAGPEEPVVKALTGWLERTQDEDGCWRFAPAVYQADLAPWFAGWTFPSLNPATCLAGLATRLGIGSDRLHDRVRALFDNLASPEEAANGDFYTVLPYVEYVPWIEHPERESYLDTLAQVVLRQDRAGLYTDAGHFFEHVSGGGPDLARRLPEGLIATYLDRLAAEQQADGGWPSPYDPAWRPWATAGSIMTLHDHGRTEEERRTPISSC